jgi:glycosyltransferase involved in cell wall biosynthesis
MEISFIVPGRNNLKYAKWSYDSIQKNKGDHTVEYCFADDASTDGTWEWCLEMMEKDPNFKAIKNDTGKRVGHTILYDKLINEVATKDIAMIFHCDMYLVPGALTSIEKYIQPKQIISLTRIEPPLHPDGPEKILWDGGVEPEEFKEEDLLSNISGFTSKDKTTEGIFAPWAFYRKDFQEIGGHDPLYAPQSKEDSDIFNRFQLNGVTFLQTWEGFVYHMTCRGSRRNTNDKAVSIYQDSPEWLEQNMRSTRNFIRKWGHFVMHDAFMKPIIPPKYNVGIRLVNSNLDLLHLLEPWCDTIQIDNSSLTSEYLQKEQINTIIDLKTKIKDQPSDSLQNEVIVEVNGQSFTNEDFNVIHNLSQILENTNQVGDFTVGNLFIKIKGLTQYQDTLIHL